MLGLKLATGNTGKSKIDKIFIFILLRSFELEGCEAYKKPVIFIMTLTVVSIILQVTGEKWEAKLTQE